MKKTTIEKMKLFLRLLSVLCVITLSLMVLFHNGYRINTSGSLPNWIYKVSSISNDDIPRGSYVVINYSLISDNPVIKLGLERHYLSTLSPMMKKTVAISGDTVLLRNDHLYINGENQGFLKVLSADSIGNPLYAFPTPITLKTGEFWLSSHAEQGFDSRYFGQIHRSIITHTAIPIF